MFAVVDGREVLVGVTSYGDDACAVRTIETRADTIRDFLAPPRPDKSGCAASPRAPAETPALAFAAALAVLAARRRRA